MCVCWEGVNTEIMRVELNGLLADKMKEPDNEDWAEKRENSFVHCHVEEGTGGKETRKRGRKECKIIKYRKRKQGGKNKKEERESRTRQWQNNGRDKRRQRQLKGDR